MFFRLDLQFFASKKGVGSTSNGRDSNPKYLGIKVGDGQIVNKSVILYRQRGTKIHPGKNVGRGSDDTLFALIAGQVRFSTFRRNKTRVDVLPLE